MKIVFMGTPDFAAVSLKRLYENGNNIAAVFTQPDKPKSRGMKLNPSPVKGLAIAHATPLYQPSSLKDGEALRLLSAIKPDLIVVVAYGKMLPSDILALPSHGCINIHGSLLPKYRGSAPIQWAVLNGEEKTGVTAMYMADEMDAGDMILTKDTTIGDEETAGELYARLSILGAELLSETLTAVSDGTAQRIKQDAREVTFAPPLTKALSPIDWTKTSQEILCQIRGLNPWPVATTVINTIVFKIYKATATARPSTEAPGSLLKADSNGIEIACADGGVIIQELQAPGGKRMRASDYLRGHPLCL